MRKSHTNEPQNRVAQTMVEDLRRRNWKIEKGPEPEGLRGLWGNAKST